MTTHYPAITVPALFRSTASVGGLFVPTGDWFAGVRDRARSGPARDIPVPAA